MVGNGDGSGDSLAFELLDMRLVVRGECDCDNATLLEQRIAQMGTGRVELDLHGVTFFDSASLRVVLVAQRKNPELRVVNPSRQVERVLEITATRDLLCGA